MSMWTSFLVHSQFHFNHLITFSACNNEDQGDSIVCGGDEADGIYFIWEGEVMLIFIIDYSGVQYACVIYFLNCTLTFLQAEVCGSLQSDDKSHAEYHLKQYDFFGHG